MKSPRFGMLIVLLCAAVAHAKDPVGTASDDAGQSAYNGGWTETGGGSGFGEWKFQELRGSDDSFASHFISENGVNPESETIASGGKSFGLFANGPVFEVSAAFRSISAPLKSGQAFSFQMANAVIEQKGATDSDAAGAIGLTLRNGNAADAPDDYNKGSRFEITNLKGEANYQVYDGESNHDTGVAYSEKGVTVTVILTGADTYDLEITRLADNRKTKLSGRKLGGSGTIESFCIFDRNGEKADAFFNHFQVAAHGK